MTTIKQIWIEAVPASATLNNLAREVTGYFESDDEYEQEILKNRPMWTDVRNEKNEGKTIRNEVSPIP